MDRVDVKEGPGWKRKAAGCFEHGGQEYAIEPSFQEQEIFFIVGPIESRQASRLLFSFSDCLMMHHSSDYGHI